MLTEALQESGNLLVGPSWYPLGMLKIFADTNPSSTINALEKLFDEGNGLKERMVEFEKWAKTMLDELNENERQSGKDPSKNHFQDTRSMSVYLAFRYPDQHYLYKAGMYTDVADLLEVPHPGNKFDKVIAYHEMCDQILDHLKSKHPDIVERSDSALDETLAIVDKGHHLLVQDIVYFMSTYDKDAVTTDSSNDTPAEAVKAEEDNQEARFVQWSIEVDKRDIKYAEQNRKILAKASSEAPLMEKCLPKYESAFLCEDADEIRQAYKTALSLDENAQGHYRVSAALNKYAQYLEWAAQQADQTGRQGVQSVFDPYSEEDFLQEVFISKESYRDLRSLLEYKRNIILQGSPGTGKTYCAKRLVWSILGRKDDTHTTFVQFHQSTTYDDLVCGYRPDENGSFEVKNGPFIEACRKADENHGEPYFFIIDEINRANISKVFGELLMLIEADHREEDTLLLPISGEELTVPRNLFIIGMMNTADRGLALIDYALRRRFAFFEMEPALDHPKFQEYLAEHCDSDMISLAQATSRLNKVIADDPALGSGFRIGHSYFCGTNNDARLVFEYELAPLIDEYWFDDKGKAAAEKSKLEAALS